MSDTWYSVSWINYDKAILCWLKDNEHHFRWLTDEEIGQIQDFNGNQEAAEQKFLSQFAGAE